MALSNIIGLWWESRRSHEVSQGRQKVQAKFPNGLGISVALIRHSRQDVGAFTPIVFAGATTECLAI